MDNGDFLCRIKMKELGYKNIKVGRTYVLSNSFHLESFQCYFYLFLKVFYMC